MSKHLSPLNRYLLPLLFLAGGLVLTYILQESARAQIMRDRHDEFAFHVTQIVDNIERRMARYEEVLEGAARMARYEEVLEGAAGLFSASAEVDRAEFADYVAALKLPSKHPGIQGVGFTRLIRPQEKAAHIAAIRSEGFRNYDIRPAGERELYSSIIYLEPFDWRNQRAFGYDMYSEPVRREAMVRARDEERATISGKVQLVQETDKDVQAGVLMYLPVYRNRLPHQSLEERRANLIGWVYSPFRMNDLMAGTLGQYFGEIRSKLDLRLYDGDKVDPAAQLFATGSHDVVTDPAFAATRTVPILGRPWTVEVRALPNFLAGSGLNRADMIVVAGSIVSTLLALVVWLLVTGRRRAEAMAEHMTEDLRASESALRKLNRSLRLLSDCNMTLVHAEEENRLLNDICRLCVERGGYVMAWVGYAEHDEARTVRVVAQSGYEEGYLEQINITWADSERGQGPTGTAIRERRTMVNQDVLTNPKMALWREAAIARGYRSSISVPMRSGGEVLGALTMYARDANAFDSEEVRLLEELANDLAFGVVTLRTQAAHAAAKEQMVFLSHFDPLTRLPNRVLLRDRFEQAAVVADRDGSSIAMLYVDIDRFQKVNDSLGHEVGDKLLIGVVERLQQCVPGRDTISRLGADEFIVLHTGIRDAGEAARLAGLIQSSLAEPVDVDAHRIGVTVSIGIALYPQDARDFPAMLKCADTALVSAEDAGRNAYRFFRPEMNVDLREEMRLIGALLPALRNREFVLHYQPQVDIHSGRIIGAEALLRWQHPEDGLISPARFIPLAEQSGYIVEIGEWVLNEACRQAAEWQAAHGKSLVMAVNLSALQFKRGNVLDMVRAALAATGLSPACLELELTESILLQDVSATMRTLSDLKSLGVQLSIDDFGTGYSSLSYLKQLSVDKLKIDQSFIRDMLTDDDGAAIVKAIIQLGHTLQLDVIAEGVETDAQLAFLGGSGCDQMQGYLFSRPVPAGDFARLLAKNPAARG